ncbi:TetR/AcrR family transcriptional regulator [Candidatus Poribacteria bacterium]|nr:TetR/AcrR family transcriptional regulator [Candidatus Poribacteria bacterium]
MAKRGRKSIANERRAQILDAFHICAVRKGLERASLREVAEEAGLPVSNLHHFFENRDEMVSELVKRIVGGIIDNLRTEVRDLEDAQTRLKRIFEFLFSPKAQKLEDGSLYYDFWSLAHRSHTVRQTLQNLIRDQRETFFEMLLGTSDISKLSKTEKREIANIIIALVEGTFYVLDMDGENVSSRRMAHLIQRFLELHAEERMRKKNKKDIAP